MPEVTGGEVVLVDDDPEVRQTVSALLRGWGYSVRAFPSAERLLEDASATLADLVIADIHLPRRSGLDMVQAVHERHPDTAILVITGYPSAQSTRQAFRSGATDCLSKPFEPQALQAAVREALAGREGEVRRRRQLAQLRVLVGEIAPAAEALEGRGPTIPAAGSPDQGPALVVDREQGRVFCRGEEVLLTRIEYALLGRLWAERPGLVDPRELAEAARGERLPLWEARELCKPHIRNLRRKLGSGPGGALLIVNVHGRGYRLL